MKDKYQFDYRKAKPSRFAEQLNDDAMIMREPFDYTKWQNQLWEDQPVEDISRAAMEFRRAKTSESN